MADAVILAETKYSFDGEVDVFTALTDVAEENDIVIVDSDGYVTGIGGLSTGDARRDLRLDVPGKWRAGFCRRSRLYPPGRGRAGVVLYRRL